MTDENQADLERDTTELVSAYLRHHQLPADQLGAFIRSVHSALSNVGKPAEEEVERTPAVPIRRSVHQNYVVYIECGWRGKMLRRHISSAHDLDASEYRRKWGLSNEHPLTAPGYSEQRSSLAKQLGLGRRAKCGTVQENAAPEAAKPSRRTRRQKSVAATE